MTTTTSLEIIEETKDSNVKQENDNNDQKFDLFCPFIDLYEKAHFVNFDGLNEEGKARKFFANFDPFYECEEILKVFRVNNGRSSYNLDLANFKALKKQGKTVWLKCFDFEKFEKNPKFFSEMNWPRSFSFFINRQKVISIDPPKLLKTRRENQLDITISLRTGQNLIEVNASLENPNQKFFCCVLMASAKIPPATFIEKITSEKENLLKNFYLKTLKKNYFSDENLFRENFLKLDLICPISRGPIEIPVRSFMCQHLQAFDLRWFIESNYNMANINLRWKCPICSKIAKPQNLYIDKVFENFIWEDNLHLHIVKRSDFQFLSTENLLYDLGEFLITKNMSDFQQKPATTEEGYESLNDHDDMNDDIVDLCSD